MKDHITTCLQTDEGTVRAFLEGHGHVFVRTFGPFTNGVLVVNTNDPPPSAHAAQAGDGPKVVIHTTSG